MTKKNASCATCRYFHRVQSAAEVRRDNDANPLAARTYEGYCRAHPPSAHVARAGDSREQVTTWPEVDGHMWCGEHATWRTR